MTHPQKQSAARSRILGGVVLTAILIAGFAWSVHLRSPWFGVMSLQHHQWHTGQTLLATRNWWNEGAWQLQWLWLDEPASVEFPTLKSRRIYSSYPPGAAVPVYLLAQIRGQEPDTALVMGWNLASHGLVTLAITVACYLMLLRLGFRARDAVALCVIPAVILSFTPAPMYWLQNTYFADEAVMLPFALMVLLEVGGDTTRNKRARTIVNNLQSLVACWGVLTDWLFYPLIAVLIAKRLLQRHRPATSALPIAVGSAIGIGLFVTQIATVGLLPTLMRKFITRSGISSSDTFPTGSFFASFWNGHVAHGFGIEAVWLLWGALGVTLVALFAARRKKMRLTAWWAAIIILPCFVQPYLLQNHSRIHAFSSLKMMLPLAAVVFILAPLMIAMTCRVNLPRLSKQGRLALWLLPWLVGCGLLLAEPTGRATSLFPKPNPQLAEVGAFLRDNTTYADLIFSDDIEINTFPPQALSLSMKRVYPIAEMDAVIARVPPEATYHVKLLSRDDGRWVLRKPRTADHVSK